MAAWMIPAAILGSALLGGSSARSAAKTQADAARQAADLEYQQFREGVKLQEPWRQAGMTALNKLLPLSTEYTPFGMGQFMQDPGYQFRLTEGLKALDRQAAARGGLISGAALKGAQRFGQDFASGEYQNAFNRYQAERQARLGPLQSLANVGQTTAQQIAGQGQQMATNVGQAQTAAAQARASGYAGMSQAATGGLQQYLNYSQQQQQNALTQQLINQMSPSPYSRPYLYGSEA